MFISPAGVQLPCGRFAPDASFFSKVEGLTGYMARLAVEHPVIMGMLLRTVLPYTLNQKQAELRASRAAEQLQEGTTPFFAAAEWQDRRRC
jgi:hypothetical protein